MSPEGLAFLALGAVAVITALAALLVRELVHTIMWIASFFVALSGLYFLLQASFLGVLQLGVYAGAVTILLLFGIMVTRRRIFSREAATGLSLTSLFLALLVIVLLAAVASDLAGASNSTTIHSYAVVDLSSALFGPYGGWLLLLGLVMLSALSGAIYLVREGRE
ncbi:MAG: NADH-quinone oxidoreductase subunit J [Thermoplasmata archaeon]|nr:NADH-quinone oxidoreductase subunit J [Thermoplasmata archaeon]MCI4341198.1 NADH-quinone oxidoreductase subunit J [Thermoplasmata archaeon]